MKVKLLLLAILLMPIMGVDSNAQTHFGSQPLPQSVSGDAKVVKELLEATENRFASLFPDSQETVLYPWVHFEGCMLIISRETQVEKVSMRTRTISVKNFKAFKMSDVALVQYKADPERMEFQAIIKLVKGRYVISHDVIEDAGPKRRAQSYTDEIVITFSNSGVAADVARRLNSIAIACKG
jgi:hypothetical protein